MDGGWTVDSNQLTTDRDRVAAGAEFLDTRRPDWYLHVNTETLHMGSFTADVLGQLYGSYLEGLVALFGMDVTVDDSESYGFTADDLPPEKIDDLLTGFWSEEVEYRLDHQSDFPID